MVADTDATVLLPTPVGDARAHLSPCPEDVRPHAVLVLGHGAGGGSQARDLAALAQALPGQGVAVVRVDQPWRVAGKRIAPAPATLDRAWLATVPAARDALADVDGRTAGLPLLLGGRSAGARVACRTALELGAAGVLALAFPLHPPGAAGRPERSRAGELLGAGVPVLVAQGERDPFGGPDEMPSAPDVELLALPGADHGLAVGRRAVPDQEAVLATLCDRAAAWATALAGGRTG
ncbi:MAG TPA: alpha/beta family hydrolase [Motilibacteraceae bacterium]|nr:alpha/beta family hydrolase [Motilibacteraceae bacterium]